MDAILGSFEISSFDIEIYDFVICAHRHLKIEVCPKLFVSF